MLYFYRQGGREARVLIKCFSNLVRRLQAFASGPDAELGPDSLERKFSAPLRRRY